MDLLHKAQHNQWHNMINMLIYNIDNTCSDLFWLGGMFLFGNVIFPISVEKFSQNHMFSNHVMTLANALLNKVQHHQWYNAMNAFISSITNAFLKKLVGDMLLFKNLFCTLAPRSLAKISYFQNKLVLVQFICFIKPKIINDIT